MQWFRLYDDLLDDPKCQQLTPSLFKHWINLLCLANKSESRGTLPDIKAIAFRLRLSHGKTTAIISDLVACGLIDRDGETLRPHNWSGRQRASDDVAERVRRHRGNGSVTLHETPLKLSRATDTDTETDTELTTPPVAPPPEPTTPSPAPVKTEAKPRSEKQKAAGALYERRMAIVAAYFRGLGVHEGSLPWNKGKNKALGALTVPILDSPECVPEIIEPLTRYTASAFAWRHGRRTPELSEVLTAFAEWDQLGRPAEVDRKSRAPTPMTQRPTQNGRVGYTPDELKAMARGEPYDQAGNGQAVIDTQFRVVR